MHTVDMGECFDVFEDKQVEITMKDGKIFTGVLDDWISALDNEPDPESIFINTDEHILTELLVKDIRLIKCK